MDYPSCNSKGTTNAEQLNSFQAASTQQEDTRVSKTLRKKTPGACEKCRERRTKCDGVQPCEQCVKRGHDCKFTFAASASNESVIVKFDLILNRLDHIETSLIPHTSNGSNGGNFGRDQMPQEESATTFVAEFNTQTGCLEYYGRTSTFVLASSLGKRLRQLEEATDVAQHKRQCANSDGRVLTNHRAPVESLGLDKLLGHYDYVMPHNTSLRRHRSLQKYIADRHLNNFFSTIHIFLPIFEMDIFNDKYQRISSLFGDNLLYVASEDDKSRPHFLCLLYAVLALGALYEHGREDSSSWAAWYFAEAQYALGQLLDAVNLELVQAAMLMGAYAQHAIKPNLAYNLVGISTRLAFSIGLNTNSAKRSYTHDDEEARRTWWLIYVQEVELSLDSGRPMSIRSCDIDVDYPLMNTTDTNKDATSPSQATFILPLAEIAKIMRKIMKLVNRLGRSHHNPSPSHALVETLQNDLDYWKDSLPPHLRFQDEEAVGSPTLDNPCSWRARQRSSLRIHYNLALIILHRRWLTKPEGPTYSALCEAYKVTCLKAASDMVLHIHDIFQQAPSLSRWSYYCYYCLQATLVLLMRVLDEPTFEKAATTARICETSVQIFEQIELKASKRCADIVRYVLDEWNGRRRLRHTTTGITDNGRGTGSRPQVFATNVDGPELQAEHGTLNGQQTNSSFQTDSTNYFPSKTSTTGKVQAETVRNDKNHAAKDHDFYDGTFDFLANTDWPPQTLEEFLNFPCPPTAYPT